MYVQWPVQLQKKIRYRFTEHDLDNKKTDDDQDHCQIQLSLGNGFIYNDTILPAYKFPL